MVTNVGKGIYLYSPRAGGKMHKIPRRYVDFLYKSTENRQPSFQQNFDKFLTKFQNFNNFSVENMWKICGKCGKCKGECLYTCGYYAPGRVPVQELQRSWELRLVKELGPAAVKELRFTGAAISSCARICQGAGNRSWEWDFKKSFIFIFPLSL